MVFCTTPFLFVLLAFELVKIVHIVVIMLNIAWEIIFIQFRGQGMNNYKNIQNFLDHAYNSQNMINGLLFLKGLLMLKNIWKMYCS